MRLTLARMAAAAQAQATCARRAAVDQEVIADRHAAPVEAESVPRVRTLGLAVACLCRYNTNGQMADHTTIIGGIVIPSDSRVFLTLVGLHVLVALTCVITGVIAMSSRKRPGPHPRFGTIYYWCLSIVVASATVLSAMRWAEDYHLFILGLLSLAAATVGRAARRRRWRHWARLHITGMGTSYILLLVAFYVDNGKNLPLWKELPPFAYWLIPTVLGVPLVLRAVLRHPLAQRPQG